MGKKSIKSPYKGEKDLDKARDRRTVPIAREVLKIIANKENLALGATMTDQERVDCYEPIFYEITELFLGKEIPMKDIGYVFQMVHQALELTQNIIVESNNRNSQRANAILFDVDDAEDITLNQIHDVLQKNKDGVK